MSFGLCRRSEWNLLSASVVHKHVRTQTHTDTHKHTPRLTHTHAARTHTCHSLRRAVTRRNKILLRRFTISAQRGTLSQVTKGQGRMKRGEEGGVAELLLPALEEIRLLRMCRKCGANKI